MVAKATSSIQVIARMTHLLEAIADNGGSASLKALSEITALHPSTAFRILASLVEHGFVERAEVGRYRLGKKLAQLAQQAPTSLESGLETGALLPAESESSASQREAFG